MIEKEKIQKKSRLSFLGGTISAFLAAYVAQKIAIIPEGLRAEFFMMSVVLLFLIFASVVYFLIAFLMKYRYKEALPMKDVRYIKKLRYEDGADLAVVRYRGKLFITDLRSDGIKS